MLQDRRQGKIRGLFEKFVNSPYYSESQLCGGAVTVSFSKNLPWQAMHFLQRSTHFSKTCCRPEITSKFLASELPFTVRKAQKSHGSRSGLYGGCSNEIPPIHFFQAENRLQFRSRPMRFLGFSNHEKGAPRQEISKWSTVFSTFSRNGWCVVRSALLAKGGTSKKRPSPHLHEFPTRSNKVSPRTLQMALAYFIVSTMWSEGVLIGLKYEMQNSIRQQNVLLPPVSHWNELTTACLISLQ
jgi:hypothetical protein